MESTVLEDIREYISKNRVSYNDLAKRSGMSRQLLWYYINGRRPGEIPDDIKVSNLEKICHALGFRVEINLIPE